MVIYFVIIDRERLSTKLNKTLADCINL